MEEGHPTDQKKKFLIFLQKTIKKYKVKHQLEKTYSRSETHLKFIKTKTKTSKSIRQVTQFKSGQEI